MCNKLTVHLKVKLWGKKAERGKLDWYISLIRYCQLITDKKYLHKCYQVTLISKNLRTEKMMLEVIWWRLLQSVHALNVCLGCVCELEMLENLISGIAAKTNAFNVPCIDVWTFSLVNIVTLFAALAKIYWRWALNQLRSPLNAGGDPARVLRSKTNIDYNQKRKHRREQFPVKIWRSSCRQQRRDVSPCLRR